MLEQWIEQYGYVAVFLGSIVEGETALVLAGFGVSRGYLEPATTFLLALAGGTLGDSAYYWIGRRYGARLLRRRRSLRPLRARAVLMLRRRGHAMAFLVRFAYGLRIVLPIAIGAARIRPWTFHPANLAASACFAALYLTLGYAFGEAIEDFLGHAAAWETRVLVGLLACGAVAWIIREWRLYRYPDP